MKGNLRCQLTRKLVLRFFPTVLAVRQILHLEPIEHFLEPCNFINHDLVDLEKGIARAYWTIQEGRACRPLTFHLILAGA